ncbi:MAG: pirin family protein [Burkholderiaceae bacterium]|nr:pirin family protein [Burkholderiaceae bacterium]
MNTSSVAALWQAEVAPVGHFTVLRALPGKQTQAVGPFVFLDHFGPAAASPEALPAHPHAGIEVMTYLLEGANEHRDSYGHRGVVQAGGAQWMRAGRGILHAETNLPQLAPTIHGLQIWARLPTELQDCEPEYKAISTAEVPEWQDGAVGLRLLSGHYAGKVGPIALASPSILLHVTLPAGASWTTAALPAGFELAIYGIAGQVQLAGDAAVDLQRGSFALLASRAVTVNNRQAGSTASLLLLGGVPAARPLVFGGPFVLDSQAAVKKAYQDYFAGHMRTLDGVPF